MALEVFDLFNYTYATLVFLLTSLYRNFQPAASQTAYPYLSLALQEAAFGPMMTMLVRPLAEIMAYTRTRRRRSHDRPELPPVRRPTSSCSNGRIRELRDIDFFLDRFGWIIAALEKLDHCGRGRPRRGGARPWRRAAGRPPAPFRLRERHGDPQQPAPHLSDRRAAAVHRRAVELSRGGGRRATKEEKP